MIKVQLLSHPAATLAGLWPLRVLLSQEGHVLNDVVVAGPAHSAIVGPRAVLRVPKNMEANVRLRFLADGARAHFPS